MSPVVAAPKAPPAEAIDRLTPETRPAERVVGQQRWDSMLFLHWSLPAEVVQRHLPRRLSVDTFEGEAWVSAALFTVSGARLRPLPALPGLSRFHEANLRTYVHLDGKDPGMWFFSLDANNALACALARLSLQLPYFPAFISRGTLGDELRFQSRRLMLRKAKRAKVTAVWKSSGALVELPAGSREHFLTQRFFLYSHAPAGRLWKQQVHHLPWPLFNAELLELEQTLDAAHELPFFSKRPLAHASTGVDVDFYPPHLV
jgi:uncharacterized protein YqjF (DUF2071 family)